MSFKQKIQTLELKYSLNSSDFNLARRQLNMEVLTSEELDLVIIGGGIVGAACANQASQKGLKVGLLEASHFSSGTSSRSSKLIHGGLRYLEQLNFSLVFESLREKNLLLKHNGHLVKKLPFIFPIYKEDRVPQWKMSLGFWLYDFLSLFKMGRHRFLNKKTLLKKYPHLKSQNLKGGFIYMDAQMDDVKLTKANLLSANQQGAILTNYSEVKSLTTKQNTTAIKVYDKLLDQYFTVNAKHVVLSLGPWTDIVGDNLFSNWKPLLSLSQGSHLCIKKEKLFCKEAIVINSNEDGRIIFIIPNEGHTLVGTTETIFNKNPNQVKVEFADIQYLLRKINEMFPKADVSQDDCLSYFSGVRPLVNVKNTPMAKTSRGHFISLVESGVSVIVGGKFTTYRKMAKDLITHVGKSNKIIAKIIKKNVNLESDILPKILYTDDLLSAAKLSIDQGMCFYLSDFFQYHIGVSVRAQLTLTMVSAVEEIFKEKYKWSLQDLEKQRQSLEKYFKDCGVGVK